MSSNNNTNKPDTSMGDLFRQRRQKASAAVNAAFESQNKQQPQQQANKTSPAAAAAPGKTTPKKSFAEIQAEQERESRNTKSSSSNTSRGGSGGGGGGGSRRSPRGNNNNNNRSGGGRSRGQNQFQQVLQTYPIEQGVICSLKESFGFIHCADRVDEVFFHFSELIGSGSANDLQVDTEVEFRIGPSPKDSSKMAAYQVKTLPTGTIVWEQEEYNGQRVRGLVERRARNSDRRDLNSSAGEGTIRLLKEKQDHSSSNHEDEDDDKDDQVGVVTTADGPLVRFTSGDYRAADTAAVDGNNGSNNKKDRRLGGGGGGGFLNRGDLVECKVVTEKRTGNQHAREVTLLLSERERAKQEQERRLLASARLEHGVVTALKGEYGFLRSSSRREEVYFHYSSIDLDGENADGSGEGEREMVLKEGQDMKFLVVEEGGNDTQASAGAQRQPRRISARQVRMQPRGSVQFYDVVCRGVTGTLIQCPQCVDSAHALDQHGKIRLTTPITTKNYTPGEHHGEDETMTVTEVFLSTQDSPGGRFSFRGGSSVGLWVQVGDTLLFDIVQDYSDGACRAIPTKYLTPPKQMPGELLCAETKEAKEEETDDDDAAIAAAATASAGSDGDNGDDADDVVPAVRLIALTLAGRAEGVIGALKEAYGFVQFAERPVDVHFKMFQLLPDELQEDLRRNMGIANVDNRGRPLRLELGAHVHFDLSVHGTIHAGGGRPRGGRDQERENLKAQRILLLPPNSVSQYKTIATGVKATVCKQDPTQPYVGNIELEHPVKPLSLEQRHPMVAKMIEQYLEQVLSSGDDDVPPLLFHDIQSLKEDDVVIRMLETVGKGKLTYSYIPQPDEKNYPGRLRITKAEDVSEGMTPSTESENGNEAGGDEVEGGDKDEAALVEGGKEDGGKAAARQKNKKKPPKLKQLKSIRYDKHSFSEELRKDFPPGLNDVVECDVVQCRRTGQANIENMKMVERQSIEVTQSNVSGVGIVKEVVAARNFGFISVIDETAETSEMLFFSLKTPKEGNGGDSEKKAPSFRKGDAVKFDIGMEKNGKRVAMNVATLPKGALPGKADKNACQGLVLLQPSYTSLKNTPVRKASSTVSQQSDKSGRWSSVDEDRKKPETDAPITELGCILLVADPSGMFSRKASESSLDGESEEKKSESSKSHLRYKNGAVAIYGTGSASAGDETTNPRRGDLVSFVQGRKSGIRDIRIVSRGAASLVRGRLENITKGQAEADGSETSGNATFITDNDESKTYTVELSEVISCDTALLKDKEKVEGVLHEGQVYGIARIVDLYLDSKLGVGKKERPKLNLTVKKDRAGKIMAQSMMAKGPDGTSGFSTGWTVRESKFAGENKESASQTEATEQTAATSQVDSEKEA